MEPKEPTGETPEVEASDKEFDELLKAAGFNYGGKNQDGFEGDLYKKGDLTLLVRTDVTDMGAKYVYSKFGVGKIFEPVKEGWGAVTPDEFQQGWLKFRSE